MNDIKKRLRDYKFKKAWRKELEFKIQELRLKSGVSGITYEDRGGKTNKISSSVENEAVKIADAEKKLEKFIEEYGLEIARIENALNMLTEKERQAIELRYIEEYNLEHVTYKVNRSVNTVKGYIKNGLTKMDKLLNN